MLILVFAILAKEAGLPYLPPGNATANRDYVIPLIGTVKASSPLDQVLHFLMPCAVLTFVNIATWSRFVRTSMLEVLRQDYVRTARAKGVRERLVILKHALRNALIPFITIVVLAIPGVWSGALITETIFNYKGLGWLYIQALGQQDWPIITAYLLIGAILVVIANLLADILYTVADPRIRL